MVHALQERVLGFVLKDNSDVVSKAALIHFLQQEYEVSNKHVSSSNCLLISLCPCTGSASMLSLPTCVITVLCGLVLLCRALKALSACHKQGIYRPLLSSHRGRTVSWSLLAVQQLLPFQLQNKNSTVPLLGKPLCLQQALLYPLVVQVASPRARNYMLCTGRHALHSLQAAVPCGEVHPQPWRSMTMDTTISYRRNKHSSTA